MNARCRAVWPVAFVYVPPPLYRAAVKTSRRPPPTALRRPWRVTPALLMLKWWT